MNAEILARDIPLSTARAAHYGTSHVPERRAEQERADYGVKLAADYERFAKLATMSGDDDAVTRLRAKIEKEEAFHAVTKAVNRIVRRKPKNVSTPAKVAELLKLEGVTENNVGDLFRTDTFGDYGFAPYEIKNRNTTILSRRPAGSRAWRCDMERCVNCLALIWKLGGDPEWEGKDHSKGKPGTVIMSDDEKREVPACLECANTASIALPIVRRLNEAA